MSIRCSSCGREAPGEEICSSCFAPLAPVDARFTVQFEAAQTGNGGLDGTSERLPDLQAVTFRPSSALYRSAVRMKGGVVSALLAFLVVSAGVSWWMDLHRQEADEAVRMATQFFESGRYEAAIEAWEEAFGHHRMIFDSGAQSEDLLDVSRCYLRMKRYTDALATLERARKIESTDQIEDGILKCHRLIAVQHMEEAKALFQPNLYGKACLEAEAAVAAFQRGEGSEAQLAGAHRMAARCSVKLKDFEGAENHLSLAFEAEGASKANRTLESQTKKAYAQYRKETVADSSGRRYIPSGELGPLNKPVTRTVTGYSSSRPRRTSSTYRPSSTPAVHSTGGRGLGTATRVSYPTYQKPEVVPVFPPGMSEQNRAALERAYSRPSTTTRTRTDHPSVSGYPKTPTYPNPGLPSSGYPGSQYSRPQANVPTVNVPTVNYPGGYRP